MKMFFLSPLPPFLEYLPMDFCWRLASRMFSYEGGGVYRVVRSPFPLDRTARPNFKSVYRNEAPLPFSQFPKQFASQSGVGLTSSPNSIPISCSTVITAGPFFILRLELPRHVRQFFSPISVKLTLIS